ncbi:unnamed protein product [Discosporangium mesarthrocarpum]
MRVMMSKRTKRKQAIIRSLLIFCCIIIFLVAVPYLSSKDNDATPSLRIEERHLRETDQQECNVTKLKWMGISSTGREQGEYPGSRGQASVKQLVFLTLNCCLFAVFQVSHGVFSSMQEP